MADKINENILDSEKVLGISEKSFNKLNDEQKGILLAAYNKAQSKGKDGGVFGNVFGVNTKNASIHIAFVICCILLFFCGADLFHSFCQENVLTSEIWNLIFPVVTLALGYIFGKGESE